MQNCSQTPVVPRGLRPPLRSMESMPSISLRCGSETPKCLNSLVLLHSEDGRLGVEVIFGVISMRVCSVFY